VSFLTIFFTNMMFRLQSPFEMMGKGAAGGFNTSKTSPSTAHILIGLGVVFAIVLIYNIAKGNFRTSKGKGKAGGGARHYSTFALHRATMNLGLDREQTKMLDYVLRSGGITEPARLLNNPELIDRNFKRAYRLIERTSVNNDELNERLLVLFATRNIIETNSGNETTTSTRQIPDNAPAVLSIDKANYPVKVISSKGDTLLVENPKTSTGVMIRLSKGSKATLTFFTKSSKGFMVETRIMGSMDSSKGPVMQLSHSGQIKKLSNRRFRRRDITIGTSFYFVYVDSNTKKMSVDKRQCTGTITDISIGGCSLKTRASVNHGQRLKVEFTQADGSTIAMLGEVVRLSRSGANPVLHIKFLKIPRKSLNAINALVYEYANE